MNASWYVRNDDLGKDLGTKTVKEEIECFVNKFKAWLENHLNSLSSKLYTLNLECGKHNTQMTCPLHSNLILLATDSNPDTAQWDNQTIIYPTA